MLKKIFVITFLALTLGVSAAHAGGGENGGATNGGGENGGATNGGGENGGATNGGKTNTSVRLPGVKARDGRLVFVRR